MLFCILLSFFCASLTLFLHTDDATVSHCGDSVSASLFPATGGFTLQYCRGANTKAKVCDVSERIPFDATAFEMKQSIEGAFRYAGKVEVSLHIVHWVAFCILWSYFGRFFVYGD